MKLRRILVVLIVLVGIILGAKYVAKQYIFPYNYKDYVDKYSKENNLDPLFVLSVIKAESDFNPNATSNKKACGLMQITEETGKDIAKKMGINNFNTKDLYNPEINIKMGTWYLKDLYKEFKDWDLVISAYNAGRGNVNKWLEDERYSKDGVNVTKIPFKETDSYVEKVNFYYKIYSKLYK